MSYQITSSVLVDGSEVDAQGWSTNWSADQFDRTWSIDLIDPITTTKDTEFSVTRGFGSSRTSVTLIDGALQDGMSSAVAQDVTKSVNGRVVGLSDPKISAGMDLYFVNPEWLDYIAPRGWMLTDGILYHRRARYAGYPVGPEVRVLHTNLPTKEMADGTFAVYTHYPTHHDVGNYLASLLGCELKINVPNLLIHECMHVSATDSLFDAINNLFSLWNGTMMIIPPAYVGGKPRLLVLDTAGEDQTLKAPRKIKLAKKAIKSVSMSASGMRADSIVDHVIILGAKSVNTTSTPGGQNDDSVVQLAAVSMEENYSIQTEISFGTAEGGKVMGDYNDGFNSASAESQKRPTVTRRSEHYHVPPLDTRKKYLLREVTEMSSGSETLQRTEVRHTYGAGSTPISTVETTQQSVKVPGSKKKEFKTIRSRSVDQSKIYKATGTALATEIIEELVLVNWLYDSESQKHYAAAPQPLVNAQNQVSQNKDTTQKLLEITTSFRNVIVNRSTDGLLRQITTTWDVLNETGKVQSQTIQDPEDKANRTQKEDQCRFEFKNGPGPYHQAKTITHPDIVDQETALLVANRVFARSGQEKVELTVRLAAPLAIVPDVFVVALPEVAVTVASKRGTRVRTLLGNDYVLVGFTESVKVSGDSVDHSIELKLRNVL